MTFRRIFRSACALVVLLLSACSSFKREWRAAKPPYADGYSGRWDGKWASVRGVHGGRLRCLFTKVDARHHRAHFRAYWGGLSGNYTAIFESQSRGQTLQFSGEHDLGPVLGGVYRYDGTATHNLFHASYDSRYDRGWFEMTRLLP